MDEDQNQYPPRDPETDGYYRRDESDSSIREELAQRAGKKARKKTERKLGERAAQRGGAEGGKAASKGAAGKTAAAGKAAGSKKAAAGAGGKAGAAASKVAASKAAGAASGAAAGSVAPGFGTAIGAVVGTVAIVAVKHWKGFFVGAMCLLVGTVVAFIFAIIFIASLLVHLQKTITDYAFGPLDAVTFGLASDTIESVADFVTSENLDDSAVLAQNDSAMRIENALENNPSELAENLQSILQNENRTRSLGEISEEEVVRYNRWSNYRGLVSSNTNSIDWQFFAGVQPDDENWKSGRNSLMGMDTSRGGGYDFTQRFSDDGEVNVGVLQETLDAIRDDPEHSKQISLEAIQRLHEDDSLDSIIPVAVCIGENYNEILPDSDRELYDLLLTFGNRPLTAGSQYGLSEEVTLPEVTDTLNAYFYRERFQTEGGSVAGHRAVTNSDSWNRFNFSATTGGQADSNFARTLDVGDNLENINTLMLLGSSNVFVQGGIVASEQDFIEMGACDDIFGEDTGLLDRISNNLLNQIGRRQPPENIARAVMLLFPSRVEEADMFFDLAHVVEQLAFETPIPDRPEMLMVATELGIILSESDFARNQGLPPISSEEITALRHQGHEQRIEEDREQGFAWRYLNPENHRSAATKVAMQIATLHPGQLLEPLTSPWSMVGSALINTVAPVQAQDGQNFDNFGVQEYGLNPEEAAGIDMFENAHVVETALEEDLDKDCAEEACTETEYMKQIYEECIAPSNPYYEVSGFCRSADGTKRSAWIKVGLWNMQMKNIEAIDCLSHDEPCDGTVSPSTTGDSGGRVVSVDGTEQELAQQIIESDGVTGDERYMAQIRAYAEGNADCNIDKEILRVTAAMAQEYSFTISSLNRLCTNVLTASGVTSRHYANGGGRAIDINTINGTDIIGEGGKAITEQFINDAAPLLPAGSNFGQVDTCGLNVNLPEGVGIVPDACNHLHIDVP